MGIFNSCVCGEKHHSAEATNDRQTNKTSQPESSQRSPEYRIKKPQNEDITPDQQRPEITVLSSAESPRTDDVDKKSIILISAGKTKILFIFPSEKISVLLQEACEWAGKKPQNMQLVFEGELLDVNKTVSEYPDLRGGSKVNLIHAG